MRQHSSEEAAWVSAAVGCHNHVCHSGQLRPHRTEGRPKGTLQAERRQHARIRLHRRCRCRSTSQPCTRCSSRSSGRCDRGDCLRTAIHQHHCGYFVGEEHRSEGPAAGVQLWAGGGHLLQQSCASATRQVSDLVGNPECRDGGLCIGSSSGRRDTATSRRYRCDSASRGHLGDAASSGRGWGHRHAGLARLQCTCAAHAARQPTPLQRPAAAPTAVRCGISACRRRARRPRMSLPMPMPTQCCERPLPRSSGD